MELQCAQGENCTVLKDILRYNILNQSLISYQFLTVWLMAQQVQVQTHFQLQYIIFDHHICRCCQSNETPLFTGPTVHCGKAVFCFKLFYHAKSRRQMLSDQKLSVCICFCLSVVNACADRQDFSQWRLNDLHCLFNSLGSQSALLLFRYVSRSLSPPPSLSVLG